MIKELKLDELGLADRLNSRNDIMAAVPTVPSRQLKGATVIIIGLIVEHVNSHSNIRSSCVAISESICRNCCAFYCLSKFYVDLYTIRCM